MLSQLVADRFGHVVQRLALGLEFSVLSALGAVHHTFDCEHVSKLFVGVERWIYWLKSFDRA